MNDQKDILAQIDRQSGMNVPDGYFDSFITKMIDTLPMRNEAENPDNILPPPPTLWNRIRPYVYLAAMFAGIWCMLKMFVIMSSPTDRNSAIEHNQVLAEAISDDSFINEFVIDDINQWDLFDEMIEDGIDATSFNFASDSNYYGPFVDPANLQSQN